LNRAAILGGTMPDLFADIFPDFSTPLKNAVNAFVDYLVVTHGNTFEAMSNSVLTVLVWLEALLRGAPPIIILIGVAAIAYAAGRRLLPALAIAGCVWLIGALGQWEQAMQTTAIIIVSVGASVLIGLPLGMLTARSSIARRIILPMLDLMQTIPSFVYLIPAAMLFGLGKVPAILATVIYATPPLIRLTDLGIRQVDEHVIEASRVFGASEWESLRYIQLPLALPSIMQGLNQTTMMALAMVVIASMIGARGVGETVLLGLQRNDSGQGFIGGIVIVLLAIVIDRIAQSYGRRLQDA
jgi:glycine betaine/proline transport system permease protein